MTGTTEKSTGLQKKAAVRNRDLCRVHIPPNSSDRTRIINGKLEAGTCVSRP